MSSPLPSRLPVARLGSAALAAALLLAACGGPSATPTFTPGPTFSPIPPGEVASSVPSAAPSAVPAVGLLLEVTTEGGFIKPVASMEALPQVVVDSDGRIYTPAVAADGSSPMIPPVQVRDTGAAGAAAIAAAMRDAGLDVEGSGGGIAADMGTTVFTATVDGNTIVNRISGGGPIGGPGAPGHPGASDGASGAPGAAALALLARLTDPAETWGAASAPAAVAYRPQGYRVFLAPADAAPGATLVVWPLSKAPGDFGTPAAADLGATGLRSGIVTGADAATLAQVVSHATAGSGFTAGGTTWEAWIRPLLPDEQAR